MAGKTICFSNMFFLPRRKKKKEISVMFCFYFFFNFFLFFCCCSFSSQKKLKKKFLIFNSLHFPLFHPTNFDFDFLKFSLWSLDTHKKKAFGLDLLASSAVTEIRYRWFVSSVVDDPLTLSAGPFCVSIFCKFLPSPSTFWFLFLFLIPFENKKGKLVIDSSYYLACFF
jgi:hypothetical protein